MKNNKFCHLHVHNEYSVLDGLGSAEDYAKKASDLGFKYLGITNHGNIDGLIKFQKACKENNIHPILGCEAYIVPSLYKKEKGEHRGHVTLLVKNQDGFENLCMMLTKANLEGFYHRPRIDFDLLYDRCDGLVILTGCLDTFINLKGGVDLFYDLSEKLRDDLYLEVMPHNISLQTKVNKMMLDIFHNDRNRYKLVATNDCHYIEKQHSETQEVLLAIQSKAKWTDPNRWKFNITGLHLRTADEMIEAFINQNVLTEDDIDDAIYNTIEVAEKCAAFEIKKQKIFLPKVPGYNVKNVSDYLYDLCCEKLKKIKKYALHEVYINRLETEFDLIEKKGFIPYFMIVYDLVKWCKENDIMVGPGRGSVGGSLMAYLLGITTVDPIRYNLLFSRFIAEDRCFVPTTKISIPYRKSKLISRLTKGDKVINKYGEIDTVKSVGKRYVKETLLKVYFQGKYEICTKDHKWIVMNKQNEIVEKQAKDLIPGSDRLIKIKKWNDPIMGIYCITNLHNNKKYFGSSINIDKRLRDHKKSLKYNIHGNIHLQRAFNKNKKSFIFKMVEIVLNKKELLPREQYYIDTYKTYDKCFGYNICSIAGNTMGFHPSKKTKIKKSLSVIGNKNPMYGRNHSEETKNKLRASWTPERKDLQYGEAFRRKMSRLTKGDKNGMYGKTHSNMTKLIISRKNKGRLLGKNNPMYGKTHSKRVKKILSERNKRLYNGDGNPNCKIKKDEYNKILHLFLYDKKHIDDIAGMYSVCSQTIINILKKAEIWKRNK